VSSDAGGRFDVRHRAAHAGFDQAQPRAGDPDLRDVVFLVRFDAAEHDVRPEALDADRRQPLRREPSVQVRERGFRADEQRERVGELVRRCDLAGVFAIRQSLRLRIEAHQPARPAEEVREPGIGDLALRDGGDVIVPDADFHHVALGRERYFERQHSRRRQAQRAAGQLRHDQRHPRQLALAQELAFIVDDDPLAVADTADFEPGRGKHRAVDTGAAATLDRVPP
jgi:hypothetical protein